MRVAQKDTDCSDFGKARAVADFRVTVSAREPEYGMICSANPVLAKSMLKLTCLRGELPFGNFARVAVCQLVPVYLWSHPNPQSADDDPGADLAGEFVARVRDLIRIDRI